MLRMVPRRVSWIVLFEAVMAMRKHWNNLPPGDRARLASLARKSRGRPHHLTREERAEFRRIAKNLDLLGVSRDLAPFGKHLRRR